MEPKIFIGMRQKNYWDVIEKVAFKLALEDLKAEMDTPGVGNGVGKDAEEGKQSEFNRTGGCTAERDLQRENKRASLNQHKRQLPCAVRKLRFFKCSLP